MIAYMLKRDGIIFIVCGARVYPVRPAWGLQNSNFCAPQNKIQRLITYEKFSFAEA